MIGTNKQNLGDMRVAGLELIKLSHISLDICLCCPSLEYIKMELHKFNSTKFLMNTQQPSKLNTKTKRNTNFSIPAFEVPLVLLMWLSGWCLKSVWTLPEGSFGCKRLFCMNDTYLSKPYKLCCYADLVSFQCKEGLKSILLRYMFCSFSPDRCRNALCFLCYVLFIFFITRYQAFSFAPSILMCFPHFYEASLTQSLKHFLLSFNPK